MSVRLYVRLSVTRRYSVETVTHIVEFYLQPTVSTALIYLFKPESNK